MLYRRILAQMHMADLPTAGRQIAAIEHHVGITLDQPLQASACVVERLERFVPVPVQSLVLANSMDGKKTTALEWYRQGRDVMEKARMLQPQLPEIWNDLAKCWFDMGAMYASADPRSKETLQAFEESRALREKVVQSSPDHPEYRYELALTCGNLAVTLSNLDRAEEAVRVAQQAVAEDRRALKMNPQAAKYRQTCGVHLILLAALQWSGGSYDQALAGARARADLWPKDSNELYAAASDFAQHTLGANGSDTPPTSAESRGRAEQLVIEILRRAVAAGFRDRQRLLGEKAFAPLRLRPDFQEVLAALQ
jgi:tetratricopeptide (TPR) repeat protein